MDIDKLLNKYFEGATSLQEEEILRNYFEKEDIAENHKAYAPMFRFFIEERKPEPAKETIVKPSRKKKFLTYALISGIAACFALIITIRLSYIQGNADTSKSIVYVNGKKTSDIESINYQALKSIENISDNDDEIISSQIDILDSFIE